MRKALSVHNVLNAKFKTIKLQGIWRDAIGQPELTGSWIIYGAPKNGKTSFAMMLAKYLSNFKKVAYDSVEEGLSLTIKMAMERTEMLESDVILLDKEPIEELVKRLDKQRSPDIVIVDSVQFLELKFSDYKTLKSRYPHKLFIYISHVEGKQPEGNTARRIWRDANVAFRIEGFRAFPVGRYGGGEPITISETKANDYWGINNLNDE